MWIALAAAGIFILQKEKQTAAEADALRRVDRHAREAQSTLSDLRIAQQAYVASGQGLTFWMPKVDATSQTIHAAVDALRQPLATTAARTAVDEAAAALADFAEVDKRARDYIKAGQLLMAADVIFTEGGQTTVNVGRELERARQAEHEDFDLRQAAVRRQEALALGGAAGFAALLALLLAPSGARRDALDLAPSKSGHSTLSLSLPSDDEGIVSHAKVVRAQPAAPAPAPSARPAPPAPPAPSLQPIRSAPVLKAAADLATDFGRVRDSDELSRLLKRSADMIDATGLVVWLGDTSGGDLRPVIAHGYSEQTLARIPSVPRNADNAAAAAYRSGATQIVLSHPSGTAGAIVAPILGVDGCVGALSAEIQDGGEASEAVQAVTAIVASHLAAVLAPVSESDLREQPRAAAQS